MWNGDKPSADRLGARTDADRGGGPSPGTRNARGDPSQRSWTSARAVTACPGTRRSWRRPAGSPFARLETRTKESDMCASQRASKPVRRKEADWRDPSRVCTADRPRSSEKGSRRRGCFAERRHGIESSKWAIFGKQNWRCGMNRKPGYGAQLRANPEPTKGVVD
ncbi:hypothetical protein GH714_044015 [Hevea brasiliensis]|uniref:Uncharacterized protein n=1 Tax=Hevea brasiliensis TaxID=3981 RepID=A0A6A6K286_HEVBR|nr:hypothetical protein GH714_044015 [Hevea brasiliensis]